mmetsp:Transcript_14203/g.18598  ORF Transcript_14203/g.18598 Transcript_14203/m.18598 type:complete len:310 (+) Transcript_14203:188-1117(+)|eukprot:CAMPEP_0117751610 /NCGR_PEP_ID=MMETSP0947-20121206/11082_1 /TAXON_ID=44440 /ORGANISM="Chattonella subsalsa, Strain CCMP2191" /LENGTH=309 /DNA_ID=CAMNT_0005570033 /DNA_START=215 /DNA_END=1147 /DNA_ORIENTATION=-
MDCDRNSVKKVFKRRVVGTSAKHQPDPILRLLGGMTSGVIEALILTPLDVTKTRLQLDTTGRYKNMWDCGKKLYAAEGFGALYKGLVPWTWHVVLKNGTRYYFNAIYRKLLAGDKGQISTQRQFAAGFLAGATEAALIVTPFEVLKTRLQGQDKTGQQKYTGTVQTALRIINKEGLFSLWNGLTPTIIRQSMNQACSFTTNSLLKKHVWQVKEGESMDMWKSALSGIIGAIPGPCLNCPADVIKTRLMNQETLKGETPKYRGPIHAFTKISREEGICALYKGLFPRLARLCPSYAIQWVVIDKFMETFG